MVDQRIAKPPRESLGLLDRVRDAIRRRHFSYRNAQAYLHRIRRYLFFRGKWHPVQ